MTTINAVATKMIERNAREEADLRAHLEAEEKARLEREQQTEAAVEGMLMMADETAFFVIRLRKILADLESNTALVMQLDMTNTDVTLEMAEELTSAMDAVASKYVATLTGVEDDLNEYYHSDDAEAAEAADADFDDSDADEFDPRAEEVLVPMSAPINISVGPVITKDGIEAMINKIMAEVANSFQQPTTRRVR